MKTVTPQLAARLANWRRESFPIHHTARINWSWDSRNPAWRYYSTFPWDVTIGGNVYRRTTALADIGDLVMSAGLESSPHTVAIFDNEHYISGIADGGDYEGLFFEVTKHFTEDVSEVEGGLYSKVDYKGGVGPIAVRMDDQGNMLALVTAENIFASLDLVKGRMGSTTDQEAINARDTSMREAFEPSERNEDKWGDDV